MSATLVQRLRCFLTDPDPIYKGLYKPKICDEAADEIERLERELQESRDLDGKRIALFQKALDNWKALAQRLTGVDANDHGYLRAELESRWNSFSKGSLDSKRLDWLEANEGHVERTSWSGPEAADPDVDGWWVNGHEEVALRAAIDAAMGAK